MKLLDQYQQAVNDLLNKARVTQREAVQKAADIIVDAITNGHKVYLGKICHSIEMDLFNRGGGPVFYRLYEDEFTKEPAKLKAGDVLIVSSVSGRTLEVVNLAYDSMQAGVKVIAFTSMEYAKAVDPVHSSGKKLYEFVTHTVDNCAPAAEAMLEVDGLEGRFAASSGIASAFLMWSITAVVVEKMLRGGYTPGILKSDNYPGGDEFNQELRRHYEEFGW